jgi:hypothetical protein
MKDNIFITNSEIEKNYLQLLKAFEIVNFGSFKTHKIYEIISYRNRKF